MNKLFKYQNIGLAFIISMLLFIVVKAAISYNVSITQFNDSEFPRVQVAMNISGNTDGLLSKHIQIAEAGKENTGPIVFLPPHNAPSKVDLHILIDTSGRTSKQGELIRANLKAVSQYIFESGMAATIYVSSFDGTQDFISNNLQEATNGLNSLTFSDEVTQKINGFDRISQEVSSSGNSNSQKVLLVVNGSDFEDDKTNGMTGTKMKQAISAVTNNDYLTFVLGYPLRKVHAVVANNKEAELSDFSHAVPGGYLGGFGTDLTSMVDLLKMQSENDFVLQYYSVHSTGNFVGSQAILRIDGSDAHNFTYITSPTGEIAISHLPENELVLGEDVLIDVDLGNYGKMVNAVELNYENKDGIFETATLLHQRNDSTEEYLRYSVQVPAEVMNDENFAYFISVQTPYGSTGAGSGLVTVPVNAYDDGIILKATLVNNSEVLWTWEGTTVAKGKSFEVWSGDTLLATTSEEHHTIQLTSCNRYQVVQVVVVYANGTKSYPSRPYEYYAEAVADGPISEKNGVMLMIECIEEKEIDTYTKIVANTSGFNASADLTLERAGIYLAKIIAEDIWKKIENQEGYFELLYYIMIFIDRDEYMTHGVGDAVINESLVHKLITKVNNTEDINEIYDKALEELTNRLRSTLSM